MIDFYYLAANLFIFCESICYWRRKETLEISSQYKEIAKNIDEHVNKYPDSNIGDESLLRNLFELMIPFKTVIGNCNNVELDYLYTQFPGFYRMASLLEAMAEGIQRGDLEMLKGH